MARNEIICLRTRTRIRPSGPSRSRTADAARVAIPLLVAFAAPSSLVVERDRPSQFPILGNGPPGTFVLFPGRLRVSLPTDQVVSADDTGPCGRWQTSTFLAALRVTGLTAPGIFDGAIDGESFRAYIEQILVPTLQPGDIVIADTLGAHKVAGIQRAIQAAGATLWYLPPYSPDLNPIELCFAKLKALVRTARCRSTETLWPFLGECLAHFSPDECRNYFRHCGYSAATRS